MPWTPTGWTGPRSYFSNPPASSEAFGDLEFRSDLDKQLSWNPLARLGYDPKQAKGIGMLSGGKEQGVYVPESMDRRQRYSGLLSQGFSLDDSLRADAGDVMATGGFARPEVWNHEFTHKALDKIQQHADSDPEAFVAKYGQDAYSELQTLKTSKADREFFTELMDDVSKGGDHLQEAFLGDAQAFQGTPNDNTSDFYREKEQAYSNIRKAGEDLLATKEEQWKPTGRPKEKGFIESLFSDWI
jgi:hypothetical protein